MEQSLFFVTFEMLPCTGSLTFFRFARSDDRDEKQDVDLVEDYKFKSYAPIVSFYAAAPDRFTDVPYPSSEDWEAACGKVFAHTFMHTKNTTTGEIEMNGNPRYVDESLFFICTEFAIHNLAIFCLAVICSRRTTFGSLNDRGTMAA